MSASEQADALNKFARERLGAKADAAAGGPGLAPPGDAAEAPPAPAAEPLFVRLPMSGIPVTEFAREIGRVVSGNGVFRRGREAVTVDHVSGELVDMTPERMRTYVEKLAITYKMKSVGEGEYKKVAETMGVEVARGTLAADVFVDQQRVVDRVNHVRMPVKRKDGRFELLPEGYDRESRIYTLPHGPKVDETMDLERAKKIIEDVLCEFPWGDWDEAKQSRSRAVIIAFMLAMFGLGLQSLHASRLNLVVVSNSPRSGKSLLVRVILTPLFGKARGRAKPDREEMRKVLDACAQAASPYLFLDNLKGNLDDANLEAFMTSSVWSGRVMGSQREFSAPRTAVVFITGNNLSLSTDLAGRTLMSELYVEESDPQARGVQRVIDDEWLERPEVRSDLLSSLWAVVRHWDAQGRPAGARVVRGYEEWSRMFGGMVACAGWGNALAAPKVEHAGDTEWADMQALVTELVHDMKEAKDKDFEFAELIDCCRNTECFVWLIDGKEGKDKDGASWFEPSAKCRSTMGKLWSGKYGGRVFVVDGQRVRFGVRGKNRTRKYHVERGVK